MEVGEETSFVFGEEKGNTSTPLERSNTTAGLELELRESFVHESWLFAITDDRRSFHKWSGPTCVGSIREVVSLSSLSLRDFATEEKNNDFELLRAFGWNGSFLSLNLKENVVNI